MICMRIGSTKETCFCFAYFNVTLGSHILCKAKSCPATGLNRPMGDPVG